MSMIFSLRSILIKILLIVSFGGFSFAEMGLPTSDKKSDIELPESNKKEKEEQSNQLPISLEITESTTDSKLAKGKGCVDIKGLKEAEGEEFVDFPMAETTPCEEVDCKNLEKAVLHTDKYQDLPTADSLESCEE
ncbi:MAG: hypothetical protein KAG56_03560 [Sulfurovaceae bacterium]|nr:hypothetical protein [Sulfurovaceae bacterium]